MIPGHTVRVIPRLDIKGPNVVKGIHLEGLRVVGDPGRLALKYCEEGADELIYMDIVATLYGRNNLLGIVEKAAESLFVPMTVGGGVRGLSDIEQLLRAGADKVAVNTAATKDPDFISQAARRFGSQCVVLSIEAKRQGAGHWEAYTDNGREKTGLDAVQWAFKGVELGAGEVLITSVDQEGTGKGYDLELIERLAGLPVPLIACGGAGKPEDAERALRAGADAVSMAGLLHYGRHSLEAIKSHLSRSGIPVRQGEAMAPR